jgi:hypothetical protein
LGGGCVEGSCSLAQSLIRFGGHLVVEFELQSTARHEVRFVDLSKRRAHHRVGEWPHGDPSGWNIGERYRGGVERDGGPGAIEQLVQSGLEARVLIDTCCERRVEVIAQAVGVGHDAGRKSWHPRACGQVSLTLNGVGVGCELAGHRVTEHEVEVGHEGVGELLKRIKLDRKLCPENVQLLAFRGGSFRAPKVERFFVIHQGLGPGFGLKLGLIDRFDQLF